MKEEVGGLRELEALKQAVQMGVKAGIYSMEDVVVLHHSLQTVAQLVNDAVNPKAEAKETEDTPEPQLETVTDEE